MPNICRICNNSDNNQTHRFREMMFGTRDEFDYLECSVCGTIQLQEIPDLSKYYPRNYYSFESAETGFSEKWFTRFAARQAAKYLTNDRNLIGKKIVERKAWTRELFPVFLADESLKLNLRSRILDVGCGSGRLLNVLNFYGFENLTGSDFFIDESIRHPNGVRIFKSELGDLDGEFDLVMFHHSLEHFMNPVEALRNAHALLSTDGTCLVRIPVVSYAWQKYGKDWVQLDAPRHISLFTEKGFIRVAGETDFKVVKTVYDSTSFQFWGSENYLRDIPLAKSFDESSNYLSDLFGKDQLKQWDREAEVLNQAKTGDQACFYMRKV